ncbi:hypothetical protein ROD_13361 [Citrobacter rodentium ICC168]|uniref:Uncharacterized protein n=1 Tax=Citrobacter rodentium (strain ICC168) TaxID=637910 RepID=D2TGT6_CITRI|nr:hypothetical protein ROD_13361 [Citrobacter rodentium ICC168]
MSALWLSRWFTLWYSVTKPTALQCIDLHHIIHGDCGFEPQSMPCTLSDGVIKKRV